MISFFRAQLVGALPFRFLVSGPAGARDPTHGRTADSALLGASGRVAVGGTRFTPAAASAILIRSRRSSSSRYSISNERGNLVGAENVLTDGFAKVGPRKIRCETLSVPSAFATIVEC